MTTFTIWLVILAFTACRAGSQPASGGLAQITPGAPGACTLSPTGGLTHLSITAPGPGGASTNRSYELYVPKSVGSASAVPLLVSLHGTGANGSTQGSLTHWSAFADAQAAAGSPFVAVFPDGTATLWLWGTESSYDVTFIFDVIAQVISTGCIDQSEVYLDGWSEGAYMAQRMACADGDPAIDDEGVVLAAVHSYAGGNPEVGRGTCGPGGRPARTIPVLLSQGLDDKVISPQKLGFPAFTAWGGRYSCSPAAAGLDTAQQLSGCATGAAVDWWPIQGQGHLEWSCQADPTWHNQGIWAFFTQGRAPVDSTCS